MQIKSALIFLTLCFIARVRCEYFSFGYPDAGKQASEIVYTTGFTDNETKASETTYYMRLYTTPQMSYKQGGIAYKKTPVTTAHNGFTSKFTYVPTMCQNTNPTGPYGGFSFFLTTSNISAMPNIGILDEFGLNTLPNVIMVGYTQLVDQFVICDWTNPPSDTLVRTLCPGIANPDPTYTCASYNSTQRNTSYDFNVVYDTKNISIFVNGQLRASKAMKLNAVPYTVGFSANIGILFDGRLRQEITNWNLTTLDKPFVEAFRYDARVSDAEDVAQQLRFIGSAQLSDDALQLVPSQQYTTGAVLHQSGTAAYRGFRTRFTWSASECNSDGLGDGFTFFVSRSLPSIGVLSSFGNGLGIVNHMNTLAVGFSPFYNEFRKCNWNLTTVDWQDCNMTKSRNKPIKCDSSYVVEIIFDGSEIKLYFDRDLIFYDITETLEPALYYVGLSAANGNNYFRQSVTDWSFNLLNYNGIDFPAITSIINNQNFQSFGNTGLSSTNGVVLTSTMVNSTGVWARPVLYKAYTGFEIKFNYSRALFAEKTTHSGLAFFLSKSFPSEQQVRASWESYGISTLPSTYAVILPMRIILSSSKYYAESTSVQLCHWETSFSNFSTNCDADPRSYRFANNDINEIVIKYDGIMLEVFTDGRTLLRKNFTMDWDSYYFGLSAIGNGGFANFIKSISFQAGQPENVERVSYSSFDQSNLLLYADATVDSRLRLTTETNFTVGAAVHPNRVLAHLGFQSKFNHTVCETKSAFQRPRGFTFFLSKNVPSVDGVVSSARTGLGIGNVPDIGLVITFNLNYFYVCSWDTPANVTFRDNPQCLSVPWFGTAPFSCGNSYIFNFVYDGKFLQIFSDDNLMKTVRVELEPRRYYVGFSGADGYSNGGQSINSWVYSYNSVSLDQFDFDFGNDTDVVTLGAAHLLDGKLSLTNDANQAGVAFYPHSVRPDVGFNSSFFFVPVNCDPVYNGADGFTLFFSKHQPNENDVLSSTGGQLGIQNVPDVTLFAYSITENEFWVANWTTPTTDYLRWFGQNFPNPLPKVACNGVYEFRFIYDTQLNVFVNGNLVVSTYMNFDPVRYYVGLSAGTGQGWLSHEFTYWRFYSDDLAN